jgi:hypothetical protein
VLVGSGVEKRGSSGYGSLKTPIERPCARPGAFAPDAVFGRDRKRADGRIIPRWRAQSRAISALAISIQTGAGSQNGAGAERGRNLYRLDPLRAERRYNCRQLLFDNRTGQLRDNGLVDCEQAYYRGTGESARLWPNARAAVISQSFRGH